jgi:hypothetical protein
MAVSLPVAFALLAGGSLLISRQQRWRLCGAVVLVTLLWLALFDLFASRIWLWELAETWSVQPVAAWMNPRLGPDGAAPLLLQGDERPSLNWYLDRKLMTGAKARRQLRRGDQQRWVLSDEDPSTLQLSCQLEEQAANTTPEGPDLYLCKPL